MKNIYKVGVLVVLSVVFFSDKVLAQSVEQDISNERARVISRIISDSVDVAIIANTD